MAEAKAEVVETAFVALNKPTIIEGFPSVGLVGAIATEYIAGELKMDEIGFITSRYLPPVILVKDGEPKAPIRIYAKENLVVIVSDTAVPSFLAHDIAELIIEWAHKRNAARIVSVGGIQHVEGVEPTVYALSPFPKLLKEAKKKGIQRVDLGFLTGVMGLLMMKCVERGIPILGLLADAHSEYPDPAAAAMVINALNKVLDLDIKTKPLLDASKKIGKKFSALMKTTEDVGSSSREQIPPMYG